MSCVHLRKLYSLCEEEGMKINSSDLVRFVCTKCGEQEVCPSILVEHYDALYPSETTGGLEEQVKSESSQASE